MTERRNDELTRGIDATWPIWDARAEVLRRVQAARLDLRVDEQEALTDRLLEEVGIR